MAAKQESQTFRVGLVQTRASADPEDNLRRTEQRIAEAALGGAQIVCLQELFRSEYFCREERAELFDLAEPVPGPTTERLARLARELKIAIVASLFERRAAGLYHNTAAVLNPDGSLAGIYRKMHIPEDPLYFEKFYFTPGDLGYRVFDTPFARIGVLVCWDQWYPEAARLMAMAGADILLYPTAIGWDPDDLPEEQQRQQQAWHLIQRAHAVANHLPVLVANRTGHEANPAGQGSGIRFWGGSFIAGQQGELIAHADSDSSCCLVADLDLARTERLRRIWPYFRDRRVDAYAGLTRRYLLP